MSKTAIEWVAKREGVFSARIKGRGEVGRVVWTNDEWQWAVYKNGWTYDCGTSPTPMAAQAEVEAQVEAQQ